MKNGNFSVIFYGTGKFAEPLLERLAGLYDVMGIVTSPDKPTGRRQIMKPSGIKLKASSLGLKTLTPLSLRKESLELAKLDNLLRQADLAVIADYGKIIPASLIELPRKQTVVFHQSLLPKYRGTSPIQWALLNGDEITGVTIIKIDEQADHGPIIAQESIVIGPDETHEELEVRLSALAADMVQKYLSAYMEGRIEPKVQNHDQASFTKMLTREDGLVDWQKSAHEIYNQYRAFHRWPGIFMLIDQRRLKVLECVPYANLPTAAEFVPGSLISHDKKLLVKCEPDFLELKSVQFEGRKALTAGEFLCGYSGLLK